MGLGDPRVGSKWSAPVSARPESGAELLSGAGRGGTHLGSACQGREQQHGQRQAGHAEPRAQPQQASAPQARHRGSQPPQRAPSPEPRARLGIRLGILRPHFRLGLRVTVRAGSAARKPPPRKRFRVHKARRGRGPGAALKSGGLPRQELANPAPPGSRPCDPSTAGRVNPIPGNCGGRRGCYS